MRIYMYILQKFTLFPFLLKDYSQDDKKQTSVVGHSFFRQELHITKIREYIDKKIMQEIVELLSKAK